MFDLFFRDSLRSSVLRLQPQHSEESSHSYNTDSPSGSSTLLFYKEL